MTFKLDTDGTLSHTHSVLDNEPFRLPSGSRAKQWEFEMSGVGAVNSVGITDNAAELL